MPRDQMEIIEIGAVGLASSGGPITGEFCSFVRPVVHPRLSDFCTELTSIRYHEVDAADPFPQVFWRFLDWIGPDPFRLSSWGAYDLGQFETDCRRHNMALPDSFATHINLKKAFSRLHGTKPMGMKGALALMGLALEGQHHRGCDDAKNIAKLALNILPVLEQETAVSGQG